MVTKISNHSKALPLISSNLKIKVHQSKWIMASQILSPLRAILSKARISSSRVISSTSLTMLLVNSSSSRTNLLDLGPGWITQPLLINQLNRLHSSSVASRAKTLIGQWQPIFKRLPEEAYCSRMLMLLLRISRLTSAIRHSNLLQDSSSPSSSSPNNLLTLVKMRMPSSPRTLVFSPKVSKHKTPKASKDLSPWVRPQVWIIASSPNSGYSPSRLKANSSSHSSNSSPFNSVRMQITLSQLPQQLVFSQSRPRIHLSNLSQWRQILSLPKIFSSSLWCPRIFNSLRSSQAFHPTSSQCSSNSR
jgi:hypothetical protein